MHSVACMPGQAASEDDNRKESISKNLPSSITTAELLIQPCLQAAKPHLGWNSLAPSSSCSSGAGIPWERGCAQPTASTAPVCLRNSQTAAHQRGTALGSHNGNKLPAGANPTREKFCICCDCDKTGEKWDSLSGVRRSGVADGSFEFNL